MEEVRDLVEEKLALIRRDIHKIREQEAKEHEGEQRFE